MSLVHTVQFHSVQEMVTGVVDIFTQFTPKDPLPMWWEKFTTWVEEQNIDSVEVMSAKLDEVEAGKDQPDWWKLAEKEFKAAKPIKSITVKTEAYGVDDDDDDEGDEGDEGEDAEFVAARDDGDEEPDDEEEEPEEEEPEEPAAPKAGKPESKK